MEDDLATGRDLLFRRCPIIAEYGCEGKSRFGEAARLGKWQWRQLMLAVQLVDLLVDRIIGGMMDPEFCRVGRRARLAEDRMIEPVSVR